MLQTRLTEKLGCRYPVVQTAMGWVADPRLVAGSCNAGGFGFLGQLMDAAPEVRVLATSRAPLRLAGEQEFPWQSIEDAEVDDGDLVLSKIDLLPHVPFDRDVFERDLRAIRGDVELLATSALRGDGIDGWCDWVRAFVRSGAGARGPGVRAD